LVVLQDVGSNREGFDPGAFDLTNEVIGLFRRFSIIYGDPADAGFRQAAHDRSADAAGSAGD
jgi:hypothetical protein